MIKRKLIMPATSALRKSKFTVTISGDVIEVQ